MGRQLPSGEESAGSELSDFVVGRGPLGEKYSGYMFLYSDFCVNLQWLNINIYAL